MDKQTIEKYQYNLQLDVYKRWEAYQYFEKYLQAHLKHFDANKHDIVSMFKNSKEFTSQKNFVLIGVNSYRLPERKIIDINEDLVPLIEDTKPNYQNLRMRYPVMFVNQKFYVKDFIINGFLLVDVAEVNRLSEHVKFESNYESDIRVLAVILNTKDEYEFYTIRPLMANKELLIGGKDMGDHYGDNSKEEKDMLKLSKKINSFAANLIQIMVNDDKNIQHIEIPESEERNIKRRKRGKPDIRSVTILRIGGTLKRYAQQYSSIRKTMNIRYFVGGFWRHYESDFYVNKKGTIEWIPPHYRGNQFGTIKFTPWVLLKKGKEFNE